MRQASARPGGEQERSWAAADLLTAARIPLAIAFVLVRSTDWRVAILWVAALTDFIDGYVARRWGSSRLGSFIDPVADKVFAAAAFGVVWASEALSWWEILAVLARDITAAVAFLITVALKRPTAIPARMSGKIVTVGQLLALLAFLLGSPLMRPIAWVTGAVAVYAILDYLAARRQAHAL
jgi:CDP-diacylglycerol--glycerol-3-phosphate 3-phosphatidyltransferase/cardiolipin synthase